MQNQSDVLNSWPNARVQCGHRCQSGSPGAALHKHRHGTTGRASPWRSRASVASRIRDCRSVWTLGRPPGQTDQSDPPLRLSPSLASGPEAADKLRALPPHLQRIVIERGPVSTYRNPSAVLLARVRDAELGREAAPVPTSGYVEAEICAEGSEVDLA